MPLNSEVFAKTRCLPKRSVRKADVDYISLNHFNLIKDKTVLVTKKPYYLGMFGIHKQRGKSAGPKLSESKIRDIIKEARSIQFPWNAIPEPIESWFKAMGGAINTQPEFLMVGALTVVSCLLGTETVFHVREGHEEPWNLFTLCLCKPGTGKTQAYKVAVESPLSSIEPPILIHEYTIMGLFDHLESSNGRALLCHPEMLSFYENLMKRQNEGNGHQPDPNNPCQKPQPGAAEKTC